MPGKLTLRFSMLQKLYQRALDWMDRIELWHLLGVACAARLVWIFLCPNVPTSDQSIYESSARAIALGQGYVDELGDATNYWPVGYPALLGFGYWLFGASSTVAFVLNLALWLVIVVAGYELGRTLYGRRAAVVAGAILGLHPSFVMHTTLFTSETPFIAGTLLVVLLITKLSLSRTPKLAHAAGIGTLIGILVYVRPTAFALLPAMPVFLLAARWPLIRAVSATAVSVAGTLLVLVPWGLRNQNQVGNWELISRNGGANLWMGNNPESDGGYMPLPPEVDGMSTSERDSHLRGLAMDYILENPLRYLALCLRRTLSSLSTDTSSIAWNQTGITDFLGQRWLGPLRILSTGTHYAVLILAVVALFKTRQRLWPDLPVASLGLLLALPFVLIVGGNRYMLPLIPVLVIFGASLFREPEIGGQRDG